MTDFQRQKAGASHLPDAMLQLQNTVEMLFLEKKALEQDLSDLRATQPVVMFGLPRPSLVMRGVLRASARLRRRYHLSLIRECGLFDADWYLRRYPDIAATESDPAQHFLDHGGTEGRDPGPYFDTKHYLHLYPDIAQNRMNPLLHYIVAGFAERRSIRPGMPHGEQV